MLASVMAMNALSAYTLTFPEERAVLIREQASSLYDIVPYFFGKIIGEFPFSLPYPLILILMTYWVVPFAESVSAFFILFISLIIAYQAGSGYALLLGVFMSDRESLINIAPLLQMPLMMLSGFAVDLDEIVPVLWPFQWISSMKYSYNIGIKNEFRKNDKLAYMFDGKLMDTETIIEMTGADLGIGVSFGCLIAVYVGFSLIALIGLLYTAKRV